MDSYFLKFEHRRPPEPVPYLPGIEALWHFFAIIAMVLGANYIYWRWTSTINFNAEWFSVPLTLAETLAYVGMLLFAFNLWKIRDTPRQTPPEEIGQCLRAQDVPTQARPLKVDVFIATYSEDEELVRLSIRDAMALHYPHPIDCKVYILDDGRRPLMKAVAEEEGAHYISRTNNIGFKAGNLRNAMEQTDGDFIVICDADTRVFPTLLEHTLGYFRDPDVAWVQTPQWFFDLPEGKHLPEVMQGWLGNAGHVAGRWVEKLIGPVVFGRDPFVNDPRMFYDVILRRRNWVNASFCCGAGSIHRRDAVMQGALLSFADTISQQVSQFADDVEDPEIKADLESALTRQAALATEFTPYRFHVSEDIYTSIVLHSDPVRHWKSVMHPDVESKMLSPQDLQAWMVQRFKYAGGTIDIALRDNPLFTRKLTLGQRLMYLTTFWSYFGCIWNFVFLVSPIIYMFTGIAPLTAYSMPFYLHFLPFILANEIAFMFGTWGIPGWASKASYLAFFPINFRAIRTVLRGEQIKFPVTPKHRQAGTFLHLVYPQLAIVVLTSMGLLIGVVKLALGIKMDVSAFVVNFFWSAMNIAAMLPIIRSAFWQPEEDSPTDAATPNHQTLATGSAS